MLNETKEAWKSGQYGSAAAGGVLWFINGAINLPVAAAFDMSVGGSYNSGVDSMAGFTRGDWHTALKGNLELLSFGLLAKLSSLPKLTGEPPSGKPVSDVKPAITNSKGLEAAEAVGAGAQKVEQKAIQKIEESTAGKSTAGKSTASSVSTYDTPFNPLTKSQKANLKAKLESRTITNEEYQHLNWDRRFANRRATGVRQFWAEERARLRAGEKGSRNWSPDQQNAILSGKRPTLNGETIEGHHKYNASDHPQIANDPKNIYPATRPEHFNRWHGGSWRNNSFGEPVNPLHGEEF